MGICKRKRQCFVLKFLNIEIVISKYTVLIRLQDTVRVENCTWIAGKFILLHQSWSIGFLQTFRFVSPITKYYMFSFSLLQTEDYHLFK